jgi:ataxia telangiectasia mutated family protein
MIEQEEFKRIECTIQESALGALKNYIQVLTESSQFDSHALYAFFSIWFGIIGDCETSTLFSGIAEKASLFVMENFASVPLFKYLPLIYQMSSRLDDWNNIASNHLVSFLKTIFLMIKRIASVHPLHVLYKIVALANLSEIPVSKREREWYDMNSSKMIAAQLLLKKLASLKIPFYDDIVKFSKAIIDFIVTEKRNAKSSKDNLKRLNIVKLSTYLLKSLDSCFIPTVSLTVVNDGIYDQSYVNLYSVQSFDEYANWASSGINRPLIVRFQVGSGVRHGMVIKTEDDLRQDAVMEQVFDLVNQLLSQEMESKVRELRMVTYNVCPLSPYVGLVEFVKNSRSMGDWLIPAHEKYYPDDWRHSQCRMNLDSRTQKDYLHLFRDVFAHFHPVFRYFFLETSNCPLEWLQRRLKYTRSAAVSSIVGYVLGLGDRHLQNILIDYKSAELVHIDLGIAFDSGRYLPIPETVPFRLTRDMLDGMGICGVDGSFKKSCVLVMDLLRRKQKMILTLLGVFVYDPLYNWSISPLRENRQLQSGEDFDLFEESAGSESKVELSKNSKAHAVVLEVKNKLDGRVEGFQLSIEGQVDALIEQATDIDRLARIFQGWSAWC